MFRISTAVVLSCLCFSSSTSAQDRIDDFLGGGFGSQPTEAAGITVTAVLVPVDDNSVDVQVSVELPANHYIYSTNPSFGAATKIALSAPEGFEAVGAIKADRAPKKITDQYLGPVEKFFGKATWTQRLKSTKGPLVPNLQISGSLTGMYCSAGEGGSCHPIEPAEKFTAAMPAGYKPGNASTASPAVAQVASSAATQIIVPKLPLPVGVTESPIRFKVSLTPATAGIGDFVTLSITAEIARPWHTYSITMDPDSIGGVPTKINLTNVTGLQEAGKNFVASPKPDIEKPLENIVLEVHYDSVVWSRSFVLTEEAGSVAGSIDFQICNHGSCLNPANAVFSVSLSGLPGSQPLVAIAGDSSDVETESSTENIEDTASAAGPLSIAGLMPFILSAISAGFLSLLTPCVFPMIPVTVSYFLKQGEQRPGSTLKLAVIYCLGIIGAFTILGLTVAVVVGPTALPTLAGNRWLNLLFAAIFILFALMLMGMFEVNIPSWLLTWSSKKQDSGGIVGVLFMALTFTLVSFTCTFAFVGSLLVVAANGSFLKPIIGMVAFSTAFASPFFFLALFPAMLKKLPKSGGWMNSVKVTLGLLELAIVAKFLSIADIGFSPTGKPQFLDFSLVIGSWIAVSAVIGVYLLGLFRLPHDSPEGPIGPVRCLVAVGCFGLSAYMGIGLLGAQAPEGVIWQQIAAFAPQRFESPNVAEGGSGGVHKGLPFSLDFDKAVIVASQADRPLFVDVTGVYCHNCRVMEQTVLATDRIQSLIKDLERVQVYTDKVPVDEPEERERLLQRNKDLQLNWLKSVALPSYAIVSPDGKQILAMVDGLQSTEKFAKFIEAGVAKWEQGRGGAEDTTAAVSQSSLQTN